MIRRTRATLALLVVAALAGGACTSPEGADPPDDGVATPQATPPVTPPPESDDDPEHAADAEDRVLEGRAADLPRARTEVTGAVWDGRIVAVGGLDHQGVAVADVDVYDPASDSWSPGPDLPVALHHTAVAALDGRVYVVGGYTIEGGSWVAQAAVWSLGAGEDTWREEPPLGTPRGALAVASTGERLVAVGGVGPDGRTLTSTEILEAGADRWEPGPAMDTPREHLAATAVGDQVYAIAGRDGGFAENRDSVEMLRDGAWDDAGTLHDARGGIGAATVGDVPCVTGGEEEAGTIGSVECRVDGAWEVVAELEVPRHGLVVVALEDRLHVIGGGPEPRLTTSDVHEVIPVRLP